MAATILGSMKDENGVTFKIISQGRNVYLGPIKIYQFPNVEGAPAKLEDGSNSAIAKRRQIKAYHFTDVEKSEALLEDGSDSEIATRRQKPPSETAVTPAPDQ